MKFILVLMASFLISPAQNQLSTSNNYGDLLAKYGEKPKYLEWIGTEKGKGQNIAIAKYRILGKYSRQVESFLIQKYGMGKLKFVCCGWESQTPYGSFTTQDLLKENPYRVILIHMYANAEKTNSAGKIYIEKDRDKIEYFYVEVRLADV